MTDRIVQHLGLEPLDQAGGYFRETYRSSKSTAIYYALTPETFSSLHKLPGDEIFHFYLGDPVEMLQLRSDGSSAVYTLGPEIENGMHVQLVVPGETWQGSRLRPEGKFALMGTTMAPRFGFRDYKAGDREDLTRRFPDRRKLISDLTVPGSRGRTVAPACPSGPGWM